MTLCRSRVLQYVCKVIKEILISRNENRALPFTIKVCSMLEILIVRSSWLASS